MKKTIYLIIEADTDEEGNFHTGVHSIHNAKTEAVKELAELHKEVKSNFDDPVDEYVRGRYFDINEEDDLVIRHRAELEEQTIDF